MKYFAYGSNCNAAIMKKKGVEFTDRRRAVLHGYQLRFNKRSLREALPDTVGFANINEDEAGVVEGILYEITDDSLSRLDESERCPKHYNRVLVKVETDGGIIECWAYQAQPDKLASGLVPSRNYLNHILSARDFLSDQYFQALDKSQAYAGECASCHETCEVVFVKENSNINTLCQPCREARIVWGDVRGRRLTVRETEAVMMGLVKDREGFPSIAALIQEAIAKRLIEP